MPARRKSTEHYAALYDSFWRNPKLDRAGIAATGLYSKLLSFTHEANTDGFFTESDLSRVAPIVPRRMSQSQRDNLLTALLGEGLIEPNGTQPEPRWKIHDYEDHQYTAAERESLSESARKNARKRWHPEP